MTVDNNVLMQLTEEIIEEYTVAVDEVIEELVLPLEHVGNPEKLIGKPYEQWTAGDFQQLGTVYGTEGKNPLTKFIIDKEWEKLKQLRQKEQEA